MKLCLQCTLWGGLGGLLLGLICWLCQVPFLLTIGLCFLMGVFATLAWREFKRQ